jgi:trk system potassium uptake protein
MVRQRLGLALHVLGTLLKFFALAYVVPLLTAVYYGENWPVFLYSLLITLAVGLLLEFGFRTDRVIERADGFTIVAFAWLLIPVFGALPYLLPPISLGLLDGLFEGMSGFSTTGATILEIVEELPKSALLWRSLTQWIGGMGVIALFIAILPKLAVGGSQLFEREFGLMPERLRPRFRTTARLLWTIYAGLTAAEIAFLHLLARLPLFDSICISLCTLPGGGFTPTTASIAAYANPVAEYIIIAFMILGGTNFLIHYNVWRGNFRILKDEEFRLYLIIMASAIALLLVAQGFGSYREVLFQATSIMTTTGFVTADFNTWNSGARMILLVLMFIGASAGSTSGGMKVIRTLTLAKHTGAMMRKAISPKAVVPLKLNRRPIPEGIVRDIISFIFLYLIVAVLASIALGFAGLDLETAVSAVATTMGNVGPGLGGVGPTLNYAWLPGAAKIILIACMWLGRLELFAVFMILSPRFWRG